MIDSTQVTLPAAQAFLSGKLEMPVSIQPGTWNFVPAWSDVSTNCILVMVAAVLMLASLNTLRDLLPHLLDSASRWKGSLIIDASMRLKSDRAILGLIGLLPLVLVLDRYNIFNAGILDFVRPQWHVFATAGTVISWLFVRRLGYLACCIRNKNPEILNTAHRCIFNFIILLAATLTVTAGLCSFTGISDAGAKSVVSGICAAFFLLNILRETQILNAHYGQFQTFLYLCASELIPAGALIAGNILL